MLLKKYKNILFDLDGTLIDTGEGIINAVFYCVKQRGMKEIDLDTAKRFVGPPLVESFKNVFGVNDEEAKECARVFRVYYADKGKLECIPYKDVKETLVELNKRGYKLFVATSKPTVFAKEILDKFELSSYFTEIVGSNLDNTRSKKNEIIDYIIDNYQLNRKETLMVGDKNNDIFGAKKSNLDSLGVLYGYGDQKEIEDAKPTLIIKTLSQILN